MNWTSSLFFVFLCIFRFSRAKERFVSRHSLSCQTPESLSCQTSALQLIKSKYPPLTRPPTRTSSRPQHAPFPPNTPTNKNSCRLPIGNFQFSVILKRGDFLDSLHLEFCRATKKRKPFFLFSKTKLGFKGCEIKNLGKKTHESKV